MSDFGRPIQVDSLEDSLFLNLFITQQVFKTQVDLICSECGISGPQYNVLRILQTNKGKSTVSEISSAMLSKDAGVTRLIDKLIKRGYVSRKRGIKDRRVVFITLTEKGERLSDIVTQKIQFKLKTSLSHVDSTEVQQLIHLLAKVRQPATN